MENTDCLERHEEQRIKGLVGGAGRPPLLRRRNLAPQGSAPSSLKPTEEATGQVHGVTWAFIPSQCFEQGPRGDWPFVSFSDETRLLSLETEGCPSVGHPVDGPGSTCPQVPTPVRHVQSPHTKTREGF